jgi:uncharacterized protein (DUF1800 family)
MLPAKLIVALALTAASTAVMAATPARLSEGQARHLLNRTGFAPTQAEVDALTGQSATGAVSSLLAQAQSKPLAPTNPAPDFMGQPPPLAYRLLNSQEERQAQRQQQQREALDMKAWWLQEMIASPTPLRERMTLFWHNHFATSQQKVNRSQAMWKQQQTLRTHALGSFRALLHDVAKDPAMLVYLDGANSRKQAPNENFAREVMELFTLGEATGGGNYSEADVREAAMAFTGWGVDREDMTFKFRPALHDDTPKTLLGRTGNFDGDQALDILLEQPAAARFIVGKLWREFVSPTPDDAQVERIARRFKASDYNIASAMSDVLLTDAFWQDANRGSLVKSPVDLIVGTLRQFSFSKIEAVPFALKSAQLGQNLLVPPNVKGWPGQNAWINATTLLERKRFTEQLFRAVELKGESMTTPLEMGASGRLQTAPGARGGFTPQMQAELAGGASGAGSNQQALRWLGRDGMVKVAQGMAQITFEPGPWLAQYGGHVDREPSDEVKARLAQVVLAVPPTQTIARGTVGVAFLRSLTLDPAYQLK